MWINWPSMTNRRAGRGRRGGRIPRKASRVGVARWRRRLVGDQNVGDPPLAGETLNDRLQLARCGLSRPGAVPRRCDACDKRKFRTRRQRAARGEAAG